MIDPQFAVDRNLNDAGCDETTQKAFLELCALRKWKEGIHLLQRHRMTLLDDVHEGQKKIDALDFLLFKMRHDADR
ncbi:MAG: hypothetical protein KH208_04815 [Desulfovibrio sp.]|uniref:hypothetical protein n=1 Tax=Desulfovibrio sp. TaxID=885 RepID=UPI0025B8FBAC|nr:hypothetical protein [Desulfovibrio sp.]MBS6829184.1 hypothetical protein [Desulfovibrio sp.]